MYFYSDKISLLRAKSGVSYAFEYWHFIKMSSINNVCKMYVYFLILMGIGKVRQYIQSNLNKRESQEQYNKYPRIF